MHVFKHHKIIRYFIILFVIVLNFKVSANEEAKLAELEKFFPKIRKQWEQQKKLGIDKYLIFYRWVKDTEIGKKLEDSKKLNTKMGRYFINNSGRTGPGIYLSVNEYETQSYGSHLSEIHIPLTLALDGLNGQSYLLKDNNPRLPHAFVLKIGLLEKKFGKIDKISPDIVFNPYIGTLRKSSELSEIQNKLRSENAKKFIRNIISKRKWEWVCGDEIDPIICVEKQSHPHTIMFRAVERSFIENKIKINNLYPLQNDENRYSTLEKESVRLALIEEENKYCSPMTDIDRDKMYFYCTDKIEVNSGFIQREKVSAPTQTLPTEDYYDNSEYLYSDDENNNDWPSDDNFYDEVESFDLDWDKELPYKKYRTKGKSDDQFSNDVGKEITAEENEERIVAESLYELFPSDLTEKEFVRLIMSRYKLPDSVFNILSDKELKISSESSLKKVLCRAERYLRRHNRRHPSEVNILNRDGKSKVGDLFIESFENGLPRFGKCDSPANLYFRSMIKEILSEIKKMKKDDRTKTFGKLLKAFKNCQADQYQATHNLHQAVTLTSDLKMIITNYFTNKREQSLQRVFRKYRSNGDIHDFNGFLLSLKSLEEFNIPELKFCEFDPLAKSFGNKDDHKKWKEEFLEQMDYSEIVSELSTVLKNEDMETNVAVYKWFEQEIGKEYTREFYYDLSGTVSWAGIMHIFIEFGLLVF